MERIFIVRVTLHDDQEEPAEVGGLELAGRLADGLGYSTAREALEEATRCGVSLELVKEEL